MRRFLGRQEENSRKEKARKVRQFRGLSKFRGPSHSDRNRSSREQTKISPRFVLRENHRGRVARYRESLTANKTTHVPKKGWVDDRRKGGSARSRLAKLIYAESTSRECSASLPPVSIVPLTPCTSDASTNARGRSRETAPKIRRSRHSGAERDRTFRKSPKSQPPTSFTLFPP